MREKFPQAHGVRQETESVDLAKPFQPDTFPVGAISEVIPANATSGILLLVAGLLGEGEEVSPHPSMVLVDGGDSFDPASFSGMACTKLLWVRCQTALEMIKAADLLIHDGNVPFIMLDATGILRRDLATIPASAWWRMKQTAERTAARVVVLAASPLVSCTSCRLVLSSDLTLSDFSRPRGELLGRLQQTPGDQHRKTSR